MHYHRIDLGLNMLPSLIFLIACSFVVVDAFIMPHKKSTEEKKELHENWEALDSEEDGQQGQFA